ncbi:hypothetical protein MPLDJ20_120571 [Mesorhizobium plurifarium]|uniref:Uncharacterized protein n=1 Tax=Mesorhizobium plurifarium TaxID=69974 RepID=A0A090GEU0_MESPL|nr:hypothetical protein MPLDJ20_120571 [Mesorhizobium plurifarium]
MRFMAAMKFRFRPEAESLWQASLFGLSGSVSCYSPALGPARFDKVWMHVVAPEPQHTSGRHAL